MGGKRGESFGFDVAANDAAAAARLAAARQLVDSVNL